MSKSTSSEQASSRAKSGDPSKDEEHEESALAARPTGSAQVSTRAESEEHAKAAPGAAHKATGAAHRLLPGLEVVGRGIHLRPYQPYSLGQLLFKRDHFRVINSKETRESYHLPMGYEVNDSPPFPVNESLNQMIIEESWERFEKQMSMDAGAAVSNAAFSVSASSTWNSRLRAEQEAYYAVRSSFVPLWMVYVPNPSECIDEIREPDVPTPFAHKHRRAYDEFFRRYGSHYVKGAWVGGKSMLIFTVLKSTQLDKEDIQAGIKASFSGESGEAKTKSEESKEKLKNSSQCTVVGKGGDEMQLAAMSSLDQEAYNNWLKTIPQNPQVIELDVAGIWTLVRDVAKAEAIMEAYKESVTFDPIRAVFDFGPELYFIRGSKFVRYNRDRKVTYAVQPLTELLPNLAEEGFERVDEAFRGRTLVSSTGEKLDRKLLLFRKNRFTRYDLDTMTRDEGFPKLISEGFPGVPFERIDAGLVTGPDSLYFFYGNQYVRFNPLTNCVDEGYPQLTAQRWVGLTFDRLDAAVYWGNSKVYFFKGDQHIRYDLANYRTDPGFPKYVSGNYVDDWTFIDD